ncbi:DNA primase DnaG [Halobacteriaceae archaeon SHR40]|uniref:DNA primase DnaG n=1 Tax=Halovenus amylolytica TaxID=2500550 RepID=UPI000FE3603B
MQYSAKYIIHADVRTSGVVERSDVVGAIFGQTEGLLGEGMDLRDLQEASKVGRIDVDIDSEGGRSFGTIKIASGLDRVETAVLAAGLETIERVGPCRANCTVSKIEDARAAKRREIVDRATELLAEFDEETLTSDRLIDEVRQRSQESDITEYRGFPAGPRVADSDAIVIVEGRADVRTLLSYGIKNAVAVEGTDIPDEIAGLTAERTTTVLLDGDRGGDLILRELAQVGEIDYVAFAPSGQSVEDLDRAAVISALRKKLPYDQISETSTPREAFAPTDGGTVEPLTADSLDSVDDETDSGPAVDEATNGDSDRTATDETAGSAESGPETLGDHIRAVIDGETETARLLDQSFAVLEEIAAEDCFDAIADADEVPHAIVIDATVGQKLLDIAAQRGVEQIIATETGESVKQPANVRLHKASEIELS